MNHQTTPETQTAENPNRLLSTKELAQYLGVHPRTIYREIDRGHLSPPMRVNKLLKFPMREVHAYLAKSRTV